MIRPDRRAALVLGAALLCSYAYFYQAGGWNQNARYGLVRAILERHTLRIDAYAEATGDKAEWQGHTYSDKAPGTSLLALVPADLAREVLRLVHINPNGRTGVIWGSYAATVGTSGLFTIVTALVILRLATGWGYSRGAALVAATTYAVASPAWCYATLLMGHAVSSGCLMLAFAAATGPGDANPGAADARRRGWLVGLWTGLAVLTEFPAAVPSAFIILLALATMRGHRWGDTARVAGRILAAGMVSAVVLFAHNAAAFGSPFHLGYGAADSPLGRLNEGFFGVTYPSATVLRELLIGSYRGLLPLAPLLAVAPIGLVLIGRPRARRGAAITAAAIAVFYLFFNAAYHYWEGGWAYGPRQMLPAVPFLALGIAPLWDSWGRWGRVLLTLGWLWGAGITLVAVSTTPQPPAQIRAPVSELLWPAFRDGDLALNNEGFLAYRGQVDALRGHPELHEGWNLGQLAGLHGLVSLLPLGVVWIAAGALLAILARSDERRA